MKKKMKWKKKNWAAENKGNSLLVWLHMWVVVVTVLFLCKYKWLIRFRIFMIFLKVDQLFNRNLPKIPKHYTSTLK